MYVGLCHSLDTIFSSTETLYMAFSLSPSVFPSFQCPVLRHKFLKPAELLLVERACLEIEFWLCP